MTKNWKILQLEKIWNFIDQKLQFTYPLACLKEFQAAGEAFSPQKGTSITESLNF